MRTNATIDILKNRRSVKKYLPKQISDEELETIIEGARYTASGKNLQPVRLVVVQNKADRDQLSAMNAKILGAKLDTFYGAPTVIVVIADKSSPNRVYDGSLVIGNLMNAAHSIGVDSCWIHRAKEEFESDEGKALLKKWGIEGDYEGIGHVILGYRDGDYPKPSPRRTDREFAVIVK